VYLFGDYLPPRPWESVMVMAFQALVLLSLCLLGSTFLSTVTNGIAVLMFYAIALVGGMVEQIGSLLNNGTMEDIGIISSLIIPSDTLWKMASHWLQPHLPSLTSEMFGPFTVINPPSVWMLAYAGVYMLFTIGASMLVFRRRDL
jgi:ABC-type transport system involved in multi-copper enzyme maturation permease subunit